MGKGPFSMQKQAVAAKRVDENERAKIYIWPKNKQI
jgi:hypothetical protein